MFRPHTAMADDSGSHPFNALEGTSESMPHSPPSSPLRGLSGTLLRGLACLTICLVYLGGQALLLRSVAAPGSFFQVDGEPIMTAVDAYHYLAAMDQLLPLSWADWLRAVPETHPLPVLVSFLARLMPLSGDWTAFALPPLLVCLAIPLSIVFVQRFAGFGTAWITGALLMTSPTFYVRTYLGRFDTDCLVPPLLLAGMYCLARTLDQGRNWQAWFLGALLAPGLLGLWWWPGGVVLAASQICIALMHLLTLPKEKPFWLRRALPCCLLLTTGAVGIGCLLLETPLSRMLTDIWRHVLLIMSFEGSASGQAHINELARLNFMDGTYALAGHAVPATVACLGFAWAMARRPRSVFSFVLPFLLLGVWSFTGLRFLFFLAPVYALGLATLATALPALLARRFPKISAFAPGLAAGLALLLAWPGLAANLDERPMPVHSQAQIRLARALKDQPPGQVWCWWDYGYMVRREARMPVYTDGGHQDDLRLFLLSSALRAADPEFAARWIRSFTDLPPWRFKRLARQLGSMEQAQTYLEHVFHGRTTEAEAMRARSKTTLPGPDTLLRATTRAYLYLPLQAIEHSWWTAHDLPGLSRYPMQRVNAVSERVVAIDQTRGIAQLETMAVPISHIVLADAERLEAYATESGTGYALLMLGQGPGSRTFLADGGLMETLVFRLLFLAPGTTPGFRLIEYNPLVGGVWAVERPSD